MLTKEKENAVIKLCQQLIKVKSYSGQEAGVADVLKSYFEDSDFDAIEIDQYGNIIGSIIGNRPGQKLLFDGHMDTVPVGADDDWLYDPFGGEIHDGKLYGRGTTDMKGALAAMSCAAANFTEKVGRDFPGEIHIAGVVHEECFEGVAAREISKRIKPDIVIIGEASQLNLKIGQRGRGEVVIETFGVPAHSASPEQGKNAVYAMSKIINEVRSIQPSNHPILGKGILELTDIKSSPYPGASVVPSYCKATYDRRLLVGETKEDVLGPIRRMIDGLAKEDSLIEAKVSFAKGKETCYTNNTIEGERFFPGWLFDEEEAYIQNTLKELKAMGHNPEVTYYNFCTNGSHYAGEAGIKTIGLGPSTEKLAHTINEYIEVEQLSGATECYYGIMKALLID